MPDIFGQSLIDFEAVPPLVVLIRLVAALLLGGVVALVYLYPYRLAPRTLVGTDIAHAVPLALVAGLGHLSLGSR